jgi:Zn-dependent protease with chaperone function
MAIDGTFFDGESARDRVVSVSCDGTAISFEGPDVPKQEWPLRNLHPIDPPSPGQPYRLSHSSRPGQRLVLKDDDFVATLVAAAPHLKGGVNRHHVVQILGWTAGGLTAAAILTYLFVAFLPQRVAFILPDEWRDRMGIQIETSLTEGARQCSNPAGISAMGALVGALAEGARLPPIAVRVYDLPILNAFAAPGDRIIFTRELLDKADAADEVAGVLAHEIGHVVNRHSEAQLVRVTGLQVLISVFSGSNGGDTASNLAALAAIFRYSREAEAQADAFAVDTMRKAQIDPLGFKRFFEKLLAQEGKSGTGPLARLGNLFATHPGTKDRIEKIPPLPDGVTARTLLTDQQWKDLKAICS